MEEFNEDDYTTKLDLAKFNEEQLKEAEIQEKEILNSKNEYIHSRHIMEERNIIELRDYDNEEEIYSSVQVIKF